MRQTTSAIHTHTHTYPHTHAHIYMYTNTHMHRHIYTCIYTYKYAVQILTCLRVYCRCGLQRGRANGRQVAESVYTYIHAYTLRIPMCALLPDLFVQASFHIHIGLFPYICRSLCIPTGLFSYTHLPIEAQRMWRDLALCVRLASRSLFAGFFSIYTCLFSIYIGLF